LGDQSIALDRTISDVHRAKKIVYRVNFDKEIDDLNKSFSTTNSRQKIENVSEKSLDLVVTAQRSPPAPDNSMAPKEFLKSNIFINCVDKLVQKHANDAVADEVDPWRKAQAIERWVRNNMKAVGFSEAMATSDHVARTLTGDCTEFAMLTAAMCRAQDIPSRTAIGVVYYQEGNKAKLGYHMWTEVWVNGAWLGLDATLGHGSVGPGHIKITDHSWNDVRSMTPLLPVMRVMIGRPRVNVVQVER
jgi:transglutaminase-like putative cysteine protease